MYSSIIRDEAFIQRLLDFIQANYSVTPAAIIPAKRGYFGETWRAECREGLYFVKLVNGYHRARYQKSFSVIEHLCTHGVDYISKIVKMRDGSLYSEFEGGVLGLFDWIEGENREDDSTKPHEYQMLARVYAVNPAGLDIPRENFSARSVDRFFAQWKRMEDKTILALLERQRPELEHCARRLRQFSQSCTGDESGFVITHGDAGGNVLARSVPLHGDKYHIIDWDIPLLAPPERDAWFWLHRPWATRAFHEALRQNGIAYTLRPERLAYYCYHMYFFYLNEFLDTYFELGVRGARVYGGLSGRLDE